MSEETKELLPSFQPDAQEQCSFRNCVLKPPHPGVRHTFASGKTFGNAGKAKEPKEPKPPKEKAVKQKGAPRQQTKAQQRAEKAGALAVLDFMGGDIEATARITGIAPTRIMEWSKIFKPSDRERTAQPVMEMMEDYARHLTAIALSKAHSASFSQVSREAQEVTNQIRLNRKLDLENAPPPETPEPKPVDPKDQYEAAVADMIATDKCSRRQAVETIVKADPRAKKYLMTEKESPQAMPEPEERIM